MALSSYADLLTAVDSWLHRGGLSGIIPDFVALGEGRIYRNLRVREMEADLASTIVAGVLGVPTDYVDLKHAYINRIPVGWLERKDVGWIYRNDPYRNQRTGVPKYIARERTNFIFAPWPTQDYAVGGMYYKRLDPLSTSLNDIFTQHPGLWLFGALCESAPWIGNDARLSMWENKFTQILAEANSEEYREHNSGSNLAMTADLISHP